MSAGHPFIRGKNMVGVARRAGPLLGCSGLLALGGIAAGALEVRVAKAAWGPLEGDIQGHGAPRSERGWGRLVRHAV